MLREAFPQFGVNSQARSPDEFANTQVLIVTHGNVVHSNPKPNPNWNVGHALSALYFIPPVLRHPSPWDGYHVRSAIAIDCVIPDANMTSP